MEISDYIDKVKRNFSKRPFVTSFDSPIVKKISGSDNRSKLKIRVYFFDFSYLDYKEIVESSKCYPQWIKYEYQYIRLDGQVFRYDDSPDHREISTFPHHKHVGNEIIEPAEKPSIHELLNEIRLVIFANSDSSNDIILQ